MGGLAVVTDVGDGEPDARYCCVHLPCLLLFLYRVRRVHCPPSDSAVLSIFLGTENQFLPVGAAGVLPIFLIAPFHLARSEIFCLLLYSFASPNPLALSAVRRRVIKITSMWWNPWKLLRYSYCSSALPLNKHGGGRYIEVRTIINITVLPRNLMYRGESFRILITPQPYTTQP